MKNKFTKFVASIDYYKDALPKKYTKYYDEITSLYLNRNIGNKSEVHKLFNKLMGRGTSAKSAIDN